MACNYSRKLVRRVRASAAVSQGKARRGTSGLSARCLEGNGDLNDRFRRCRRVCPAFDGFLGSFRQNRIASKNRDPFDTPLGRDGKLETYNSSNPKSLERLGVDGFDASDELSFGSDSGV